MVAMVVPHFQRTSTVQINRCSIGDESLSCFEAPAVSVNVGDSLIPPALVDCHC